jgi:hypothetical protein
MIISDNDFAHRDNPEIQCAVCHEPIDQDREAYTRGRGKTILGPEYVGLIVSVHDRCAEKYTDPFGGLTEGQRADMMAGFDDG